MSAAASARVGGVHVLGKWSCRSGGERKGLTTRLTCTGGGAALTSLREGKRERRLFFVVWQCPWWP